MRALDQAVMITLLACLPVTSAIAMDRGKQVTIAKKNDADQMLSAVENAVWAADGQAADKQVYVVYNTECPWSQKLYKDTRGMGGKVQFRWIPATGAGAQGVAALRDAAAVGDAFAGRSPNPGDAARAQRAVDYNALRAEKDRLTACLEKANINAENFEREWYLRGDELDNLRAQLAEAQRDSERLDWMIEQCAYVVSDPDCCDGYWLRYQRHDGTVWVQATEHATPRAAIDAAMGEPL